MAVKRQKWYLLLAYMIVLLFQWGVVRVKRIKRKRFKIPQNIHGNWGKEERNPNFVREAVVRGALCVAVTIIIYQVVGYPIPFIFGALLSGYGYRKSHALTGGDFTAHPDGDGTDYQMKVRVHNTDGIDNDEDVYLNGKSLSANMADLRFTKVDGETEHDHTRFIPEVEEVHDTIYVDGFVKQGTDPILEGDVGQWDAYGIRNNALMLDSSGNVVTESGNIIMYYNGKATAEGDQEVGRATSSDGGKTWTKYGSNPVYQDSPKAGVGSVIKLGANSYIMYYHQNTDVGFNYATSTDGITWVKNTDSPAPPILEPDDFTDVTWMGLPYVTLIDETWQMVFEASSDAIHIHMATSADGLTWAAANGGDPIYSGGGAGFWDSANQANPSLYEIASGKYVIFFNGEAAVNAWDLGVLYSTTLTSGWTSWVKNPIIKRGASGTWDDTRIEGARIVMDDVSAAQMRLWYFGLPTGDSIQDGKIGYALCDEAYEFLVEIIDDLESNQTMYIYYGKAGDTTASNGANTFLWYEDYTGYVEDSNLDGQGTWSKVQGDATDVLICDTFESYKRGHADINDNTATDMWKNIVSQAFPFRFHFKLKTTSVTAQFWYPMLFDENDPGQVNWLMLRIDDSELEYYNGGDYVDLYPLLADMWFDYLLNVVASDDIVLILNGKHNLGQVPRGTADKVFEQFRFWDAAAFAVNDAYYDSMYIAKWATVTQPTHGAWGAEESAPVGGGIGTHKIDTHKIGGGQKIGTGLRGM